MSETFSKHRAHYIFNAANAEQAAELLHIRMWGVDADEPHRDALAPGDLVLLYLGAPHRVFIGRAALASAARDWTAPEAEVYPGEILGGVSLAEVEDWDPPVPMETVLAEIDPSEKARADFDVGVVRITAGEYATALAVAARRR